MAAPEAGLAAALADRYRLERELGAGGMATVHLATDLRHDRHVAIKVLRPELAATIGAERFLREIDIAAHLTHPNILPVFDSGEAGGFLYYVMPYVDGASLRERIASEGTLPVDEAVRIARQVADALDYAHRQGVVHRDVKPGNILFEAGHAVVADFGIGRAMAQVADETRTSPGTSPGPRTRVPAGGPPRTPPGAALVTLPGMEPGTPAYMSPEQIDGAADVDGRSDQYSLACTLWEMLTGERPFTGDTPASVFTSQVAGERPALTEKRPDAPRALDEVIRTGLARSPDDRYETVGEFGSALKDATSALRPVRAIPATIVGYLGGAWLLLQVVDLLVDRFLLPDWVFRGSFLTLVLGLPFVVATASVQRGFVWKPRRSRPGVWGLFTWRNTVAAGVVVFAVLGLGTAAYALSRALGVGPGATLVARGELDELDRIVLANLESAPADSGLARSVGLLLEVDLGRSPTIRIAAPAEIAGALRRMERDAATDLDVALASEVALREGFEAVLAGELSRLGSSYVVSVRLLTPQSGGQLVAERETAASAEELPGAVARLSERLRERIGEPLRSIRAEAPLARVTTPSIEALRLYTEGDRAALRDDYDRAIPLLEEALALDPNFAMAYRKLASVLANSHRDPERRSEVSVRGFELRDRLPARERLRIEGAHFWLRDPARAIQAYTALRQRYPDEVTATARLSDIYLMEGDPRRAEELASEWLALTDSLYWGGFSNKMAAQIAQGRWDDAEATLARMAEKLPADPRMLEARVRLASARGDYAGAEAAARVLLAEGGPTYETRVRGHEHLSGLEYARGRLQSGDAHLDTLTAILEREGVGTEVQRFVLSRALVHLLAAGDTARALRETRRLHERYPLGPLEDEWTAVDLVRFYSAAGQSDEARAWLERLEEELAPDLAEGNQALATLVARARGYVALAEGRPAEAVAELRRGARASGALCYGLCVLPWLARAFDEAGQPDSAIAVYEEYVNRPMLYRGRLDAFYLGPAYERLAQLYEARGALDRAAAYHARLVELWEEADASLEPRVRVARERVETLLAEPRGGSG